MPKLPPLKPREIEKILQKAGFVFIRQRGSHRIYVKEHLGVTVPFHNKDLRKGTLQSIIKQSGLTADEFLTLKK